MAGLKSSIQTPCLHGVASPVSARARKRRPGETERQRSRLMIRLRELQGEVGWSAEEHSWSASCASERPGGDGLGILRSAAIGTPLSTN